MGFGDTPADSALREAWHSFCDELERAGDSLFHEKVIASADERAEAFRYLAQSTALGFLFHVENRMPRHPYLMAYFEPDRKQAGDNPDARILGAFIDGRETYRISGRRGSATWLAFTVLRETRADEDRSPMGPPYDHVLDTEPLLTPDLVVDDDGTIEVVLSPEPHDGNWIRTTPDTRHVRVREFFGDWSTEEPSRLRIERIGDPIDPPALLTPERWMRQLETVGRFVDASATIWPHMIADQEINRVVAHPNIGMSPGESWSGKVDANPGGVNASCHWRLAPHEALVVEWTPTPAYHWLVELDNIWFASVDYRWRLSSLNARQVELEHDGSVRMVVSHVDPGVPNWLDASGWSEGTINIRMLLCEDVPSFRSRVVDVGDLDGILPADARRIDRDGRLAQLRRRRDGVHARFGA